MASIKYTNFKPILHMISIAYEVHIILTAIIGDSPRMIEPIFLQIMKSFEI